MPGLIDEVETINHKKELWFFLLGLCLFFVLSCGKDTQLFKKDKVIARVDDSPITEKDLIAYYQSIVPVRNGRPGKEEMVSMDLKKSLLEKMIEDKLLLIQAAKTGIVVTDDEVNRLYEGIAKDYGNDFEVYLKKLHLTPQEWKKRLRRDLLIDKVIKRHMRNVKEVTKEEIEAYYHSHLDEFKMPMQYRISQIVVPTRKQAEQILAKLKEGIKFQSVAKQYSIFPEGKRGGELGYWREDRLPEELEVVRQMQVGEISKVLHSPYGYHIVKLTGIKDARSLTLREAGPKIARRLRQERREKEKIRWLKELKKKAHIVRDMEALKGVRFH